MPGFLPSEPRRDQAASAVLSAARTLAHRGRRLVEGGLDTALARAQYDDIMSSLRRLERQISDHQHLVDRRLERLEKRLGQLAKATKRGAVGRTKMKESDTLLVTYLTALGGLKPDDAVLDVGCGRGTVALQLTEYLSPKGRYDGFDIRPHLIERLTRTITRRYPSFRFKLADIYNSVYNPTGTIKAGEFTFPYTERSFEFVFLFSIFTHMFPKDVERYISEIARVTRPGGRSLITYFLLNDESRALIDAAAVKKTFKFRFEHHWLESEEEPERAIALDEGYIRGLYEKYGMRIVEPIHYGKWCGREVFVDRQDIVVAEKL